MASAESPHPPLLLPLAAAPGHPSGIAIADAPQPSPRAKAGAMATMAARCSVRDGATGVSERRLSLADIEHDLQQCTTSRLVPCKVADPLFGPSLRQRVVDAVVQASTGVADREESRSVQFSREDIDNIVEGLPSETGRFIDRQFAGYVTVLDAYVTVGEWETRHHIEPLATAGLNEHFGHATKIWEFWHPDIGPPREGLAPTSTITTSDGDVIFVPGGWAHRVTTVPARTRSHGLQGLAPGSAFMCGFNLPLTANLRVACVWVQRLSGSGLARGAIGGRDMQLEHAIHLAQHWELDVVGKTNDEIIRMVLARGFADGYIQTVRGRDARGHKRRKRIGTRRKTK